MVAKCLAQGVAADMFFDAHCLGGVDNHAVSLKTGKRCIGFFRTWKQIGVSVLIHFGFEECFVVFGKYGSCLMVQENPVFFSGFLFPDDNVFFYTAVFVDGIMGQVKNVADAQGGVQAEDYDGIIAYVLLGTLVIVLKVL